MFVLSAPVVFVSHSYMVEMANNMAAAASIAIGSTNVPLAVFSGDRSSDVASWSRAALHALSVAGLNSEEKARQGAAALVLALSGAARACVDAAADEDRATPAKVLALLADAFPSPAASASALDRLLDLRMGRMCVNEYAAHFKLAVHQYSKDMKDAELVSFFLRGLDTNFRARVEFLGTPTDLKTAIEQARAAELTSLPSSSSSSQPRGSQHGSNVATLVARGAGATSSPTSDHITSDHRDHHNNNVVNAELIAQVVAAVLAQQQQPSAHVYALAGSPSSSSSQPQTKAKTRRALDRSKDKFTADGSPICNYCSNAGHIARHCPDRKRAGGDGAAGAPGF